MFPFLQIHYIFRSSSWQRRLMRNPLPWNDIFDAKARELYPSSDPSHDFLHIRRVVHMAMKLALAENADPEVVLPAAYFHDFVNLPKNDPRRAQASRLSAEAACEYLGSIGYPPQHMTAIHHAIAAHSFSAAIRPETIEAKVVQDADRLDGLGAIGIARCFTVSGLLGRPYYNEDEIFPENRPADDRIWAVDHFFVKLFKVAEMLQTPAARAEGQRRVAFMKDYLAQLESEA
jgi:uncharacterized protein